MADQTIKINVGTSFSGEGLTKATNAVAKFSNTAKGTANSIKSMTDGIGILGNEAGKLPGQFGKAVGGLSQFLGMLTSGPGAIGSFVVACGMLGVSIGKSIFGPIRDANKEFNELLRKQGDIAKNTHELYDKWRKKWADADKAAKEAREKAAKKAREESEALGDALYDQWKVEQNILKTERELAQVQNKGEWDTALANEKDPYQKKILQAQANQAATEMSGKNKLANAEYDIENAQRDTTAWRTKALTDAEAKVKFETAQKKLDLAVQKYNVVFEEVTQANQRAAEALAEVEEEIRKQKRDEAEFNRQQRIAISEEAKKQEERGKIEEQIKNIDMRILEAKKKVQDSERVRQQTQTGMNADNARHSGISGRGYEYSTDENGNLNRFDQFRRAQRYARNEAHGGGGGDGDNTYNANAQKAIKLQGKLNSGKKLSKQDQQWLDDWNDFNNQDNVAQDQLDELKEIKTKLNECLGIK